MFVKNVSPREEFFALRSPGSGSWLRRSWLSHPHGTDVGEVMMLIGLGTAGSGARGTRRPLP